MFNTQTFFARPRVARTAVQYARKDATFMHGGPCSHVMYIQAGGVKLSVVSKTGREGLVAVIRTAAAVGDVHDSDLLPQPSH